MSILNIALLEDPESHMIRLSAFEWLKQITSVKGDVLDWHDLNTGFKFKGENINLIGARGIWKPRQIRKFPISIASNEQSKYDDQIISDSLIQYSYQGKNRNDWDNVSLRETWKNKIPLIYLHKIIKGKYFAAWPVFIVGDEPDKLRFTVSVESEAVITNENVFNEPIGEYRREYKTREVLFRLHQKSFRERVLHAYREHCAICSLKHRSLLDAAHIICDREGGSPEVTNGLSLCKIHHAAFDQDIIGITPDYRIEVRQDILQEIDGPMLRYGIQRMNNQRLIVPRSVKNQPSKLFLEYRYEKFRRAI